VIPGISGFYGNWVKTVRAGHFIVIGDFVINISKIISIITFLACVHKVVLMRIFINRNTINIAT